MRRVALVLVSLATLAYGRKLVTRRQAEGTHAKSTLRVGQPKPLESLARLLSAPSGAVVGWQGAGHPRGAHSSRQGHVRGTGFRIARGDHSRGVAPNRRQAARGPIMFEEDKQKLEEQLKFWRARETSIRSAYQTIVEFKVDEREEKQQKKEKRESGESDGQATKNAVVTSVVAVVIGALVLRVGGRAALVSLLGLDMVKDMGIGDRIDDVEQYVSAAGGWGVALFFAAWVVAKVFLIDPLSIALAFSAGVLFGGVIPGTALSVCGATLGSLCAFGLSRTFLKERVEQFIEKQPVARGLRKVVEQEGFKTVLVLRLSPVLPVLPVAAYPYIYGTSSLNPVTFGTATALGSIKPYLLDSYVGVISKELLDGDFDSSKDVILLGGFGVLVLLGVFATQVANEAVDLVYEELQEEEKNSENKEELAEAREALENRDEGSGGFGFVNGTAIKTFFSNFVPLGLRTEAGEVFRTIDKYVDDQWVPAVSEKVLLNKTRMDAFNEAWKEQKWDELKALDVQLPRADETAEERAEKQRMAEWALAGPWWSRQAMVFFYSDVSLLKASIRRWQDFPSTEEDLLASIGSSSAEVTATASAEASALSQGSETAAKATEAATLPSPKVSEEEVRQRIEDINEKLAKLQEREDRLLGK